MERCPIKKGNKSYKICMHGTYENEQCGHRLDCYRDANEECTEKREFDNHDKRCRTGYMCNKELGICVGPEGRPDTWQLKLMTIIGRPNDHKTHTVDDGIPFEGL
ncbi:uncharacterized protein LOC113499107 [Trichoplusia ni]|uniref:Uncharacterized protein LOC113499107 n=1 Tax=Trichoplusia ni TaxID=7111 RepID=A0A7E5W411_TRINI|nr:uncharacterized protein LOC113499107 [Trichoplusia ni]